MRTEMKMNRNGHMIQTPHGCRPNRLRGFTAIEIAMVATVIAIFALLVLPIFRNRVEEAKIAAAKSDLASLMKAETLVQADTGFYLRLEDLDNIQNLVGPNNAAPPNGVNLEVPLFVYPANAPAINRRISTNGERIVLSGSTTNPRFRGPYVTRMRFDTYANLKAGTNPYANLIFRSTAATDAIHAPVQDFPGTAQGGAPSADGLFDSPENLFPVDPWGNPYLFFPASGESPYFNSAIYCLGPNGVPGNGSIGGTTAYRRVDVRPPPPQDQGILGADDDMQVQF